MKIRQLFLPRPLRVLFKKGRRAGVQVRGAVLTAGLRAGFPRWVACDLARQGLSGRIVVAKQGVLGVITPSAYLRYATTAKARLRLTEEAANWQRMREQGFGDIIARFADSRELPEGMVLAMEPLAPIAKEGHTRMMLPLVRRLVAASVPQHHAELPSSIAAGLDLAHELGSLPPASETELRAAFADPLRTGHSHQDLHWRNVLHRRGEPVLIDLKKCQPGRLLCLDLLNMACLSLAARTGGNVLSLAHEAHRAGWNDPDLAPLLALVDLPRAVWGPAYVLHLSGIYRLGRKAEPGWAEDVLFRRILEQDWASGLAP